MQRIANIIVVGCGSWSTHAHLPSLVENPVARIVGAVDTNLEARTNARKKFGAMVCSESLEEILPMVSAEGVVIATPHSTHYQIAKTALLAGLHVLIEKPMVLEPVHGSELMTIAKKVNRQIIVGYPWHFNPQVKELRKLILAEEIGEIESAFCFFASSPREYYHGNPDEVQKYVPMEKQPRPETFSDPSLAGGGQGQTQLTHSAALLFWLTGLQPQHLSAMTESFELPSSMDIVDSATVRFSNGALGTIASTGGKSLAHPEDILELRIFGSRGHVIFNVMKGEAKVFYPDGKYIYLGSLSEYSKYPHFAPAQNLVDVILGKAENLSPATVGQTTVEFIKAMYDSAKSGCIVTV